MPMTGHREVLHRIGRVAVAMLGLALLYATAAPLVQTDEWWIRLFDFPRIQFAILMGVTLVAYAVLRLIGRLRPWEHALAAMVGLGLIWQLMTLVPYSALHPKEMSDSDATDDANRISLLVFNVLADNRDVAALRHLIRDLDPDLILLSEPNAWWHAELEGLADDYPYTLQQPQENQYGKLLYSRLELVDPEVRFLIEPGIPSIRTMVMLRSGTAITLYGLHPRPPGLEEAGGGRANGEREDSDVRDAELLLVAQEVRERGDAPVVVAGDFNDVAWSRTTRLFQRVGGLLDPRVGRGFVNTFDATSRFLRYPLDHVFASEHFRLVDLRRLPDIGSDHFPLLVVLDYDPSAVAAHDEPQPTPGDRRAADKAVDKGKVND